MTVQHPFITRFRDEYRPFSNFWYADVTLWGITFPTNEHGYVYCKNPDQFDPAWLRIKPGAVKLEGKGIDLRPDWEEVKAECMRLLCEAKFTKHEGLRDLLISTGEGVLIEGNNWHDTEWGVCDGTCKRHGPHPPFGRNLLGRTLMDLRAILLDTPNPYR